MGMQLEETPEIAAFEVELRRESFYIHSRNNELVLYEDADGGTVEISYSDIPKLRAVLDLVESKRSEHA